jgi:signal transduction histidine kinase
LKDDSIKPAPKSILIVDDQPNSVKPIIWLLKKDYAVEYADSLPKALSLLKEHIPDLILIDVHLGPDSGFDLFKKIRALPAPEAGDVPILFLSGVSEVETRVSGLQLGAADFILKPCELSEMVARIELQIRLRENEKLLTTRNRELLKAYDDLRAAQAQAIQAEKLASIGRLSAGIAHEMSTPLSFIISNLKMLVRYIQDIKQMIEMCHELSSACAEASPQNAEILKAQAKQVLEMCERFQSENILKELADLSRDSLEGSEMIARIANDLREYSRDDQEGQVLSDLSVLMDKALNLARGQFGDRITVQCDYKTLSSMMVCNPSRITQLFLNLLVNAAQAIEDKGLVRIAIRADADRIFVSITDTGCGIKEEQIKKIFDPFFTTKSTERGTGLGLSIAAKIVDSHGGTIAANSQWGKGTTITVVFPLKGAAAAEKSPPLVGK